MGVKDLWSLLCTVKEECCLEELRGKTLAVDLSCWICQAQTAKGLRDSVVKPHLRNLFYRVHHLYSAGVSLVVVVDGEATPLKWLAMDQREGREGGASRRTGQRRQLNTKVKECCALLTVLGVPFLRGKGEAESLCAQLNASGVVDGVVTEDSDVFLYGAKTVYKGLSTTEKSFQVSKYTIEDIESKLGITRADLIGLALLLGCDYCPQGVPGVGKEGALKLLRLCKSVHGPPCSPHELGSSSPSCDLLELFRMWKRGGLLDQRSLFEERVQRKAMSVPGFPNEHIIAEFLTVKDSLPTTDTFTKWRKPQLKDIQELCRRELQWPAESTHKKSLSLLTQWIIRSTCPGDHTVDHRDTASTEPASIVKKRVRQGQPCYEVEWIGPPALTPEVEGCESQSDLKTYKFITLENASSFNEAFPGMCSDYDQTHTRKQRATKIRETMKSSGKADTSSGRCEAVGGNIVKAMGSLKISSAAEETADTENKISHLMPKSFLEVHKPSLDSEPPQTSHCETEACSNARKFNSTKSTDVSRDVPLPLSTDYRRDVPLPLSTDYRRDVPLPLSTDYRRDVPLPLSTDDSSGSEDDPLPLFERVKRSTSAKEGSTNITIFNLLVGERSSTSSPQAFEVQVVTHSNALVKESANSYKDKSQLATSSKNVSCCPKRRPTGHEQIQDNTMLSGNWQTYFDQTCLVPGETHPLSQPMSHKNNLVKEVCDYRGHSEVVSNGTAKTNCVISPQAPHQASLLGGTAACPIVLD